jgi:hypothetical protein
MGIGIHSQFDTADARLSLCSSVIRGRSKKSVYCNGHLRRHHLLGWHAGATATITR